VLAHHYPTVPNWGDMTKFKEWPDADVDVLVGGTPCQSFSVAGLRQGLCDPRGNLALVYLAIADRYRPDWVVWENVPGVLSSNGGRDFGSFLGGLGELGYGWAYRVLDAQYVRIDGHPRAVPQRRRRVFVVGHLGDWRRAAAVLFERESMSGHPAPRREAGKAAPRQPGNSTAGGGLGTDFDCDGGLIPDVCGTLSDGAHMGGGLNGQDAYTGRVIPVARSLRADGFDASEDGTGRGTPLVPVAFDSNLGTQGGGVYDDGSSPTVRVGGTLGIPSPPVIAFNWQNGGGYGNAHDGLGISEEHAPPSSRSQVAAVTQGMAVRRLVPEECEALQAFPRGYTDIPWRGKPHAPDGPRYKALGNSMACNVMRWLGQRIAMVAEIAAAGATPNDGAAA
jgi:DNA (cytosine-5)-methyltransferase 1